MARCTKSFIIVCISALAACAGSSPPGKSEADHQAAAGAARAEVSGFHSARFGMDPAQVRDAVVKDFRVPPGSIRTEDNTVEKTQILAVSVPDVLPGGGTAEIAYVFGYKSHRLELIGITWSAKTDPALTEERLVRNSRLLAEHFKEAGYRPDSIETDVPLSDGTLVFRGADKAGHATLLTLHRSPADTGAGANTPPPTALTLYYIADPQHPDVYTSGAGR